MAELENLESRTWLLVSDRPSSRHRPSPRVRPRRRGVVSVMHFGSVEILIVLGLFVPIASRTKKCGSATVKYLKLHKVGSTVLSNAIEHYGARHNISLCPYEPRPGLNWKATVANTGCGLMIGHPNSETIIREFGFRFWMDDLLPNAVTVILLREPGERILSRYFSDHLSWTGRW